MKNYKKNGFSLAEILITLGIISVIAILGFSIGKKGIKSAYSQYWYTGYQGLYDAIFANSGELIDVVLDDQGNDTGLGYNAILNLDDNGCAPNHICYDIGDKDGDHYDILMRVPATKEDINNTKNYTEFRYYPELGVIAPRDNPTGLDISNRKDLLPFYIDNGHDGRVFINNSGDTVFTQSNEYMSAHDAICSLYSDKGIYSDCSGIASETGVLKFENPKKVF